MLNLSDEEKRKLIREKLISEYKQKNGIADEEVKQAEDMRNYGNIANVAGRALTDLSNAKEGAVLYQNAFKGETGKPEVIEPEQRKWDDSRIDKLTDQNLKSAKDKRNNVYEGFKQSYEVEKMAREASTADQDDEYKLKKQGYELDKLEHDKTRRPVLDSHEDKKMGYDEAKMQRDQGRWAGDDAFEDAERAQKKTDWGYKNKANQFESEMLDPNSRLSQNTKALWQTMIIAKAKEAEAAGDKKNGKALRDLAKNANWSSKEYYDSLKMDPDYKTLIAADIAKNRARSESGNSQRELNKEVYNASKDLSSHQQLRESLGIVDKALMDDVGMKLDELKPLDGKLYAKDGKRSVDLSGVSIQSPLFGGRYTAHSPKAQALQAAASRVFNQVLKDRSGGSVTGGEHERLKTEFESGKMNNEASLIKGLQDYKRAAEAAMRNQEAGFTPEAREEYRRRGGKTSVDYGAQDAVPSPSPAKRRRVNSIDDL